MNEEEFAKVVKGTRLDLLAAGSETKKKLQRSYYIMLYRDVKQEKRANKGAALFIAKLSLLFIATETFT